MIFDTGPEQFLRLRRDAERDLRAEPGEQVHLVPVVHACGSSARADGSASPRDWRSLPRARLSRDRTVPTGTPSAAAISSYDRPLQAASSSVSRSSADSRASAAASCLLACPALTRSSTR